MRYRCPRCNRYGMQWDARAKVLICYYNTCNYVIRINNANITPTPEQISGAIRQDNEQVQHRTSVP